MRILRSSLLGISKTLEKEAEIVGYTELNSGALLLRNFQLRFRWLRVGSAAVRLKPPVPITPCTKQTLAHGFHKTAS